MMLCTVYSGTCLLPRSSVQLFFQTGITGITGKWDNELYLLHQFAVLSNLWIQWVTPNISNHVSASRCCHFLLIVIGGVMQWHLYNPAISHCVCFVHLLPSECTESVQFKKNKTKNLKLLLEQGMMYRGAQAKRLLSTSEALSAGPVLFREPLADVGQ